jgi:hypothetical protein
MPAPGEAQSAAEEDVLLDTDVSLDPEDILDVVVRDLSSMA